jgi:hypothetical protein
MSNSDNNPTQTYSGDITITGSEDPPIEVTGPEDVFVRMNSIGGNLAVHNAEYVFTHSPLSGSVATDDVETTIRGDLEDGYVQDGAIDGDLLVTDAEDVFIPGSAVDGDFEISGVENIYKEADIDASSDPDAYDSSTTGWRESATVRDPSTGVYATGAHHTIEIDRTTQDIDVYVVGYDHDVKITGKEAAVSVYFLGYENTITVGPYLSVESVTETGFDNEVVEEPYPAEDLIETSKKEAFASASFGRHKLTYQVPATDEKWCPNCGTAADAVIERRQLDAFFLFSHPIKVYGKSMDPAMECEHCSINAVDSELSERERKDVLG